MSEPRIISVVSLSIRHMNIAGFLRYGLIIEVDSTLADRLRSVPFIESKFLADGVTDTCVGRRVYYVNPRIIFRTQGEFYRFFDLPTNMDFHVTCTDFDERCAGFRKFCEWAYNNPEKYERGIQKAASYAYNKLVGIIRPWEVITRIQGITGGDENLFPPIPEPKVKEFLESILANIVNMNDIELRVGSKVFRIQITETKDYKPFLEDLEDRLKGTGAVMANIMRARIDEELDALKRMVKEWRRSHVIMPQIDFKCIKTGMQVYYDYNARCYIFIFPISFKFEYVYKGKKLYRIAKKWQKRFKGFLAFIAIPEGNEYKITMIELWKKNYDPFYGPHSNPDICLGDYEYILGKTFKDPVELIKFVKILEDSLRYINMDSMYGSWDEEYDSLREMLASDFETITELVEEERRREEFSTEEEYEVPPEEEEYPEEEEEDWEEY